MVAHVVVCLSDTHGGYRLGQLSPDAILTDDYKPALTASQKYLWELQTNACKFIKRYANGAPITIIHGGDPCHGMKYVTELVTTSPADQIKIAVANWRPLLDMTNVLRVRCATSTEAHSMGESSTDHLVVDVLRNEYPGIDFAISHHGLTNIDGYTIDWAHHGPGPGSRVWLGGNVARYYLTNIILTAIMADNRPPDMVLRGHMHTYTDEIVTKGKHRSRIIMLPAMCMPGRHSIQVTQSLDRVTVGMMVFRIDAGRLVDERQLFQTIDLRTMENVN
jgi:hypothetical protein